MEIERKYLIEEKICPGLWSSTNVFLSNRPTCVPIRLSGSARRMIPIISHIRAGD